ncbi:MAG: hypothetical protein LBG79_00510 [Spirochaetaceae bacterium]|nr:hypothetical protein [Spirochaetaceae bacterium]
MRYASRGQPRRAAVGGQPWADANAQAIEADFASEAKQIGAESAFFAGRNWIGLDWIGRE